jgi:hypothetical protein
MLFPLVMSMAYSSALTVQRKVLRSVGSQSSQMKLTQPMASLMSNRLNLAQAKWSMLKAAL